MKKYTVLIEETVVGEFEIIAKSEKEALENIRQRYKEANLVLEPGELHHTQMAVVKLGKDELEWVSI